MFIRSQANWLSDVGVTIYSKFLQEFIEDVKVGFFSGGPSPSVSVALFFAASLIKLA